MASSFVLVTPVLPWPADQGNKHFLLDVARALRTLGPLTLISRELGDESTARKALEEEGLKVLVDPAFRSSYPWHRLKRRLALELRSAVRRRPRELFYVASAGVCQRAEEALSGSDPTWAVGAYWTTWPALMGAPRERRVLIVADVEHLALPPGEVRRRDSLRRAELEAFSKVGCVLCLTVEDQARVEICIEELPAAHRPSVALWPVRFDSPSEVPAGHRPADQLQFLIHGHWQAAFNRDGLRWFLQDVWDETMGDLNVLGRELASAWPEPAPGGVSLVGWADDLSVELSGCDAVIIPLRHAGGLRYRMLEAMAAGRPVVCTPVAAAGIGAQEGLHYLAFEDRAGLHLALDQLRQGAGREIALAAHTFLREHYGPEGQSRRLSALFPPHS